MSENTLSWIALIVSIVSVIAITIIRFLILFKLI